MTRYLYSTKREPVPEDKPEPWIIPLICLLLGIVAATVVWFGIFADHAEEDAVKQAEYNNVQIELQEVKDRPLEREVMPLYLQTDPQWAKVSYAGGTIADQGCGLTAAAMAVEYMCQSNVTPDTLALAVGDTCLTDGVNDPAKFCDYIKRTYGADLTGVMWTTSEGLEAVANGYMVFAGMQGYLGDRYYDGHVVLIWRVDSDGWYVRDPADGANSQKVWSVEELHAVDFRYFYGIKKESNDE